MRAYRRTISFVGTGGLKMAEQNESQNEGTNYYQGDYVMCVIEKFNLGFCLGNVVKYILRAGKKTPDRLKDLKKARWYLDREITNLEAKNTDEN